MRTHYLGLKALTLFLSMFLIVGCNSKKKQPPFNPAIPVEIDVVGNTDESSYRNYVGTVQSEMKIALSFPLGGTLTGVYVHNGQRVKQGALVAKVDETTAKSLHDAALATLNQAEDGYRRMKQVYDEGGVSQVRWVQMETDLEKARQTEISTRKHLQECTLYAPQDGIISMEDHVIGEHMAPAEPFCNMVDMDKLMVSFSVPEKEIGLINIGDHATTTIPALNDSEKTIVVYDKALLSNPLGHSYTVKASISPNEKDVLPGMVTKIRLALSSTQSAGIVVPSSCVQTIPDGIAVWVIRGGKAYRQKIEVSDYIKNGVLVNNGLNHGDTIVTVGYQKLYNGAVVSF
ncbi:MAG: efflux RND transporter periplasmic adaptor subunit [Bacteroidales bacterium]|nr:efflux RND transporter periplasmic adaptor subunit [Bacteroidales bacterium]